MSYTLKLSVCINAKKRTRINWRADGIVAHSIEAPDELIMVESGSTDGTAELFRTYYGAALLSEHDRAAER